MCKSRQGFYSILKGIGPDTFLQPIDITGGGKSNIKVSVLHIHFGVYSSTLHHVLHHILIGQVIAAGSNNMCPCYMHFEAFNNLNE